MRKNYNNITENEMFFWACYEYANHPLAFVKLSLSEHNVFNTIRCFEALYGDTEQDVTLWAVEFQIFTRMLVFEQALMVNPKYLDLSDEATIAVIRECIGRKNLFAWNNAREKVRQMQECVNAI